jgi:hypothetical protein
VKRNYLTTVLVVLGLGAIGLWIAKNTHWEEVEEHTPPRGEAATNPFYSAQHLAELLGAHTRLRHEIVTLPSTQAVMVLSFWNWGLIPERSHRIEQWVHDGGRLVVSGVTIHDETFDNWTGVKQVKLRDVDGPVNRPGTCGPLTRRLTVDPAPTGVSPASSSSAQEHFEICHYLATQQLVTTRKFSWRLRDRDGFTQALRIPVGRGSVTLINAATFGNLDLLCGDSGLLFTAATQLRRGDDLEFLTDGKGGSLLALLWSYGWPVIVLAGLLIVLWLWRSGVRFGPLVAAADPARRSLAEQIRGTGQFILRFGGGRALYAATARALNEAASRRVPRYERLSGEERVAALTSLTGLGSAELSAALDDPAARRPKEIRKTIAFLEAARRRITYTR